MYNQNNTTAPTHSPLFIFFYGIVRKLARLVHNDAALIRIMPEDPPLTAFTSNFDDEDDGYLDREYHGQVHRMSLHSVSSSDMESPVRRQHNEDSRWYDARRRSVVAQDLSIPLESLNATRLKDYSDLEIDDDFICRISLEIMTNPVYDPAFPQQKYDLLVIQHWLKGHHTNPITRTPLSPENLVRDDELKDRIDCFMSMLSTFPRKI